MNEWWVVMRAETDEIYRSEADAIFMAREMELSRGKSLRITKVIEERNKYGNGTEENATEKELDRRSHKSGS